MTIVQGIILGIIQGLAEFLPISSSGHLVLFQKIFGIDKPNMTFDVLLHFATLIPVFIIFWKDIFNLIKNPFQRTTYLLVIGTLPAVVAALLLGDQIETLFLGGQFLAIGFFITAIVLTYADKIKGGSKKSNDITYLDALFIGMMQAVAIAPGISRSGSTIAGSLFRNLDRETAAKFSFLLSIPAILGAGVLEAKDIITGGTSLETLEFLPMFCGFIAAMLSGYLAIKVMLKIVKQSKLSYFAYYVAVLGILIAIDQFITGIFL